MEKLRTKPSILQMIKGKFYYLIIEKYRFLNWKEFLQNLESFDEKYDEISNRFRTTYLEQYSISHDISRTFKNYKMMQFELHS